MGIAGVFFIIVGISNNFEEDFTTRHTISNYLPFIAGGAMLFYAFVVLNTKSRLSPKIRIDAYNITFRKSIFSHDFTIPLHDLQQVCFGKKTVSLIRRNGQTEHVRLRNPQILHDIKDFLTEAKASRHVNLEIT